MNTNIDYWKEILEHPTSPFKVLFQKENEYLCKHIQTNSKVLDIGCGNGRNILSLLNITNNITGIDNDTKAIEDAKKNLKQYPAINLLTGTAFNLPFPEKTFDYAILMMTLVNLADDKQKTLEEMKRVIKENGKIISVYSEKALKNRLEIYKQINLPIKEVSGGLVIINENVETYFSEQFTKEEFGELATKSGLIITNYEEVRELAYIFTLKRI
ncbi:MAG: class I SAM-dependent methyltransferase [Patescibacteria group bacterium]